jgi:dethiobiotin synthetase
MKPLFISGIGTGIGKTLIAAIITEALEADYWKPVQAGFETGTDSEWIRSMISNKVTAIHPEAYTFQLAASPHIAARQENQRIGLQRIRQEYQKIKSGRPLVIEGAGGLMVPLNETDFVIDLIKELDARVILVSRHYLGSINHSLLTASVCRSAGLDVAGWVFNDNYLDYSAEIVAWSGYPALFSLPLLPRVDAASVSQAALRFGEEGKSYLYPSI